MPTSFTRARIRQQSSSEVTLYTCNTGIEATINLISLTNLHSSTITVSVEIDILGSSGDNVRILSDRVLAIDETFMFDGVINLIATDKVQVLTNTNNVLDVFASIIENTYN